VPGLGGVPGAGATGVGAGSMLHAVKPQKSKAMSQIFIFFILFDFQFLNNFKLSVLAFRITAFKRKCLNELNTSASVFACTSMSKIILTY
jgi:hypothetical protein